VLHIHNSESENTCSYNSLGKHCQIMFLRTFGGRRPPTELFAECFFSNTSQRQFKNHILK
jgi:hypothetical protein